MDEADYLEQLLCNTRMDIFRSERQSGVPGWEALETSLEGIMAIYKNDMEKFELLFKKKDEILEHITSEILSRLPPAAESKVGLLFAFGWRYHKDIHLYYGEYNDQIINIDEQYSNNHTVISKINNLPPFESLFNNDIMVGSCNGLVCFSDTRLWVDDPICISNPLTGEYVYLPKSRKFWGSMVCGFGYHHNANEYKVVRIFYPDQLSFGQVELYTLGNAERQWRNKGEIPYSLSVSSGTLVNGVLHWLDYRDWKIVAFDLADEEFRVLPSPPCFHYVKQLTTFYQLLVLGGCLSVVHHERGERVDIWSLKKNSDDEVNERNYNSWSWSKEYSIAGECLDEDGDYEPFALTKSNEVLLWYNGMLLFCYHPKTGTLKKLMDDDMGTSYFQAILHVNNSVSLEALGEMPERSKKNQSKFEDDWILV